MSRFAVLPNFDRNVFSRLNLSRSPSIGQKLKGRLLKGSFDKAYALTCWFLCLSLPHPTPLPIPFPFSLTPPPRTPFAKTTPGRNYPLVSARIDALFKPERFRSHITSQKTKRDRSHICSRTTEIRIAAPSLLGHKRPKRMWGIPWAPEDSDKFWTRSFQHRLLQDG